MGALIRTKLIVSKKTARQFAKMDPKRNPRIFARAALEVAFLIQANAANVQILKGGGGAKARKKGIALGVDPKRLTSRTGRLRGDIAVDRTGLPQHVEIGSDLSYAGVHEFGLAGFKKRAFMAPALKAVRGRIGSIIARHWRREAGL